MSSWSTGFEPVRWDGFGRSSDVGGAGQGVEHQAEPAESGFRLAVEPDSACSATMRPGSQLREAHPLVPLLLDGETTPSQMCMSSQVGAEPCGDVSAGHADPESPVTRQGAFRGAGVAPTTTLRVGRAELSGVRATVGF